LDALTQTGGAPDFTQFTQSFIGNIDAFGLSPHVHDGHDFLQVVGHSPDDQSPVQQVDGHPMGTLDVSAAHCTHASVGRHHQNGAQSAFQRTVELGETFDVQHVYFVNEQDARH